VAPIIKIGRQGDSIKIMFEKKRIVKSKNKLRRHTLDPSKRMLIKQLLIGFLVLSLATLFMGGLWYGTRLEKLTINKISITGGQTISHVEIKQKTEALLVGNYLGLIPKRFIWWYPHEAIFNTISDIPRIKNLVINRVSGTEIGINFEEYFPDALWCNTANEEQCVFIDSFGYAFGEAPKLSGDTLLRYSSLEAKPAIGTFFLDSAKLAEITKFIMLLKSIPNFTISSVQIDAVDDVFYILSAGGELKASLLVPAETVFANLQSILEAKEFSHLRPGNFQYIDLRFGNKVYVNDNPIPLATSTATTTSSVYDAGDTL